MFMLVKEAERAAASVAAPFRPVIEPEYGPNRSATRRKFAKDHCTGRLSVGDLETIPHRVFLQGSFPALFKHGFL